MKELTAFALLSVVTALVVAVPVANKEPNQCADHCRHGGKFKYAPGVTYLFDYSVTSVTEVIGASDQSAKLKLDAKVEIEIFSPCEFGLTLKNVQLLHTDGNGQMTRSAKEYTFRQTLEKSVLHFAFDDGLVHQICPLHDDPAWAVNIKRGVLSVFQNGMADWNKDENRTETDLAGVCKTNYVVSSAGYFTTVVKRSKDILSCTQRHHHNVMYQMVPYDLKSDIQSLPIMKTTHECEHSIQTKGLLTAGHCKEMHVYRPFSQGHDGAATTVDQTLTYNGERRGIKSRLSAVSHRTNLLFDHKMHIPDPERALQMVESKLGELCDITKVDIRPETPRLFSELVTSIRLLQHRELTSIYRRLKSKTICAENQRGMKFFMDSLPMAPTAASIRLMSSIIKNEEINEIKARMWLTSLAFIQSPTIELLKEVTVLLDDAKTRADAMLPVSSLVYNFCGRKPSFDCVNIPEVNAVMTSMMRGHNIYCDTRRGRLAETLLLLRGLGNAGLKTKASSILDKCMTSRYSTLEVKVTAAQAFRRMPCDSDDSMLWTTLRETDNDSELRISAYLSLMRCPDDNLPKLIAFLTDDVEYGHVGTFIYSHLTNLKETSNPHKEALAQAISRLKLKKKFDGKLMENSINFEKSVLINKLNTGFTSDSNIIWSDKEQLPHSISTNFSVEVFGNSINLLDLGARVEGFKYLARRLVYGWPDTNAKTKEAFQISLYGRVFGNEVLFRRVESQDLFESKSSSDTWLDSIINLSQQNDYSFTQSLQFLDSGMVIPTASGFPLTICVNGTAVVDVIINGKVDLRKVTAKPRSITIDGEISPSAAVELNSVMSVDVYGRAQSALRMRNVMHTSTGLKGRVILNKGQLFNLELDTPKPKMEIFEARSDFFIIHNEEEREQKMIVDNRKDVKFCTGDTASKWTGMELCGQASFPNASMQQDGPYFPLTGPASVKVVMTKTDRHLGYKLFIKRIENKKSSIAQIIFNTPGSKVDRKVLMDLTLNYPKKEMEVNAVSPWMKGTFKGEMVNTANLKRMSGDLTIDESLTYGILSEVKITSSKGTATITPTLKIQRPGKDAILLKGNLKHDKAFRGIDAELSLSGLQKDPYKFKGKMSDTNREKSLTLSFTPPNSKKDYAFETINNFLMGTGSSQAVLNIKSKTSIRTPVRNLLSAVANTDYRRGKNLKMDGSLEVYRLLRKMTLNANVKVMSKGSVAKYNSDIRLKSPKLSGRLQGQTTMRRTKFLASRYYIDYTIPRVSQNRINMNLKYSDRSTKAYSKYNMRSLVTFKKHPQYNMGLQAALDFKKRLVSSSVNIKYGPNMKDKNKQITWAGSLKKNVKNWKNAILDYNMKADAPELNLALDVKGKHSHNARIVDSVVQMNYAKGKAIKMGLNLKDQSTKRKKMNGNTYIHLPGHQYTLTSSFNEDSPTQITHSITLMDKRGTKNQIDTKLNFPRNRPRSFSSNVKLDGMKPVAIGGSIMLDPKNFRLDGQFKYAKDLYKFMTSGKYAPNLNRGKISFEGQIPSRKISVAMDGGTDGIKHDAAFVIDWNANRKIKKSILTVEMSHLHKTKDDSISLASMFKVTTPFTGYEDIGTSVRFLSEPTQSDIRAYVSAGQKSKAITSHVNIKKPLSIYNAVITMNSHTPFRGFRQVEMEFNHKMNPVFSTILKTVLEKHTAELTLSGESNGDEILTDLKGNLALKSNIHEFESVILSVDHTSNGKTYTTSSKLSHNGDMYSYLMNMDHTRRGWKVRNKGDVSITTPTRKFSTVWKHKNGNSDVDSSVASKWDDKVFTVKFSGAFENGQTKTMHTGLTITSPWQPVRNLNLKITGKQDDELFNSKSVWNRNGRMEASMDTNLVLKGKNMNFDMMVSSPFHEDITNKMSLDYQRFPTTGSFMLQWSPKRKVEMMGSMTNKAWNNADFDIKVTTPLVSYRNVVWKMSSKMEKYDHVIETSIDTGVRRYINMETRFRTDKVKMVRFKMTTPFDNIQSLDTGIQVEGDISAVTVKGDFEARPHVDKIAGLFVFKNRETLTANAFLTTPFPVIPSFEMSLLYEKQSSLHLSRLSLKYPAQISGTIETSVKTNFPLSIDTKITSTKSKFNNIGFSVQHDHSESKINSHFEIVYQPGKKIESDVIGSWLSDMEGSVRIKTPFRNMNLAKAVVRHRGNMKSFNSHGEVSFGRHRVEVDGSFNEGYTTTGAIAMTSSYKGMENVEWTFKKRGPIRNMKFNSLIRRQNDKISMVLNNKYLKDHTTMFLFSSPYTENFKAEIKQKAEMAGSYDGKLSVDYGRSNILDADVNFYLIENSITGNTLMKYKLGRNQETVGLSFSKLGPMADISFVVSANRNEDVVNLKGAWKYEREFMVNFEVKTPFNNFQDISMQLLHVGDIHNFKSSTSVTFMDDQTIDGKIEFAHGNWENIRLQSELTTPFSGVESTTLKIKSNGYAKNMEGNVDIKTTIGKFGVGSLSYRKIENTKDSMAEVEAMRNGKALMVLKAGNSMSGDAVRSEINFKSAVTEDVNFIVERVGLHSLYFTELPRLSNDVKISMTGMIGEDVYSLKTRGAKKRDDVSISIDAETPFRGYENPSVFFKHSGNIENFKSEAIMKLSQRDVYSGKINFYRYSFRKIETDIDIVTPLPNFARTKFRYRHEGDINSFKCFSSIDYGTSKKIEYEMQIISSPVAKYAISLKTPYSNYKEIKSDFSYDINSPRYLIMSDVNAGNGYVFSLRGDLDTSDDITGSLAVSTPIPDYTDLSANFNHQGNSRKFNSDFNIVYTDRKNIRGKINFDRNQWQSLNVNAELSTPFRNIQKTKLVLKHNSDNLNSLSSSANFEYGYRKKMDATLRLTYGPSYDFQLDIKSPFRAYRTVKIFGKGELTSSYRSYKGFHSIIFNRYDAYTSNVGWNIKSLKDMDGYLTVYIPEMGMTKASYYHRQATDRKIEAMTSLEYDNGKIIQAGLIGAFEPKKEVTMTVKTPFDGYKDMKGTFMLANSYQNYAGEISFDLENGRRLYRVKSGLDYSTEQIIFSSSLHTPFPDLKKMEVSIKHGGSMKDFNTYVYFYLPKMDALEARTAVTYNSLFDSSLTASLKSAIIPDMDDIKLDIKSSDVAGEKKMTTALRWTDGKMIMSNMLYRQQAMGWSGDKYHVDFSLTTPFPQVESLSMQLEQLIKTETYEEKFVLEMNGDQLWDMDLNLGYGSDDPKVEWTVRQPWPMQMTAKTALSDAMKEAVIYVNWDRDEAESNINIRAVQTRSDSEQDFNLEMIHPSRTMGVSYKTAAVRGRDKYDGKLYWNTDDDSRLMYSLEIKDDDASGRRRRRRRSVKEGTVKIGVPGRTMILSGTYSGQGQNHGLDTTFSWDADEDTSKKMEVKASVTGTRPRKGDITITFPSMNKEMKMEGEWTVDNGRTILDTRTDFLYSQDSRKTVTLTSKLEDIKDYGSSFNYSLTLGISHPYTRVDIQTTSHIGQSNDKLTIGTNTVYMTARKQRKNLVLLAEINKIKRTLNVQMTNPMHKMIMSGQVVSEKPYKVQMVNTLDSDDVMKWDVTIDSAKKAILINSYYNADGRVALSAIYPNSTTVEMDITRHTPLLENREVVSYLSLWSPQHLHGTIIWRPGMMQEMTSFVVEKVKMRSDQVLNKWKAMNEEVIEELSAKYSAIANAISEEVKPLLEDIRDEMREGDRMIQNLMREIDEFYRENNVYEITGESGRKVYTVLRKLIAKTGDCYRDTYMKIFQSMLGTLEEWRNYPMKDEYFASLEERLRRYKALVRKIVSSYEEFMNNIDDHMLQMRDWSNDIIKEVKRNTYVKDMSDRIVRLQRMDVNIGSYIPDVQLSYYPMAAADWTMDKVSWIDLSHWMDRPGVKHLHGGVNEIYQQGRWAYNYWQVKENAKKHLETLLHELKLIVQDEIMQDHNVQFLVKVNKNPFTVWMPDQGRMEMDLPLPLPIHRLDEMPDWSSYMEELDMDFSMVEGIFEDFMTPSDSKQKTTREDVIIKPVSRKLPSRNVKNRGRQPSGRRRYRHRYNKKTK